MDTAAALDYLFGQVFSSAAGHLVLDMAGMVPAAGELFDFANGVWYTIEGDGASAAISFASTIPLVYATTVKNVGRVIKLADGSYQILKLSSQQAEAFIQQIKRLNLDDDALKLLNQDLNNKAFAEGVGTNPELFTAWKKLDDIGSSDVLRMNPEALGRVKNYLDADIDILKQGDQIKALIKNGDEIGDVLDNGLVRGKFSRRDFDPSKSGGPIQRLNWQNAVIDNNSIAIVEKHTSRFLDDVTGQPDPLNTGMIERLKKIKNGEIPATDYDRRFIAHELREYDRYKNLGVQDGVDPGYDLWNDAHSATIEDFQFFELETITIQDGTTKRISKLYHPDLQ